MVAIVAQGGIRGNECKTLLRLTQSGSHQLEIMEAHFAHIRRVKSAGNLLHQWNVDKFMSFFLRGVKGAREAPTYYFQLLGRPGRTAKLHYFHSSCGFDPHCL
jgi:hypothetical protein